MSGPLSTAILSRLGVIRDLYRSIREVTVNLLADFSPDALDETIRKRSLLLMRIDQQERALYEERGSFRWAGSERTSLIREHISAIDSLDRQLAARITDRMEKIRHELSSLSDTSTVARAYTRNSRH